MITKTIMCPHCKNKVTIQGNPGEKTYVTCPKCNTKGVFTFPEEKSELKTTTTSFTIEVNGLTDSVIVNVVEEEPGEVVEIPTQEIPEDTASTSGDYWWWWIIVLILGVCAVIIVATFYIRRAGR